MIKGSAKKHKVVIVLIVVGFVLISMAFSAFLAYRETKCTNAGGWWNEDFMICQY